jgi:hypothetical protein
VAEGPVVTCVVIVVAVTIAVVIGVVEVTVQSDEEGFSRQKMVLLPPMQY